MSQHYSIEVPSGVINGNNTKPLGDHWTMHRTWGKCVLWLPEPPISGSVLGFAISEEGLMERLPCLHASSWAQGAEEIWYFCWGFYLTHLTSQTIHDDVIKWRHFPCYWPFVRGIHRSPVNSPHKGQWHGVLIFSLICAWANGWTNHRDTGHLRCHRAHYNVIVMPFVYMQCAMSFQYFRYTDYWKF